jgi:hypothetical protein
MPKRTLRQEPARSSQTCGYQMSVDGWDSTASYCGDPKVRGLYYCQEHHNWVAADYDDGVIRMAPGNAIGR